MLAWVNHIRLSPAVGLQLGKYPSGSARSCYAAALVRAHSVHSWINHHNGNLVAFVIFTCSATEVRRFRLATIGAIGRQRRPGNGVLSKLHTYFIQHLLIACAGSRV